MNAYKKRLQQIVEKSTINIEIDECTNKPS